jgi:hypothetical protein
VRRRSRSITAFIRQPSALGPSFLSHHIVVAVPNNFFQHDPPCVADAVGKSRTLSVPLIHRVPGPLAAVLNVPDLGETSAGNAEELCALILVCWSCRSGKYLVVGG